ncbi:phage shock protein PspC (stress-responsive transcriptional regulator) [Dyadobacter sp. BE34]|uniref:Phage shock protein PspC (Stress-responsive transcriptional regulator) n=1 Tax=Dyadobacter fermentans TaxID=94254 RepID=A0ABU1QPX3_9BACT|nr:MULTISPECIES: PspC domain-containing protein [Dyadobacter]MDR6803202.1 phage shock protein PspC (stress-responsive transcriptional regulator) [Dyadobacter fermentans]MDR7040943.1 phage shock protein PspC (stress-responsive transcriptional regulator) [Dyadobacter sp. BE242]MDR7195346.1 phage shock protein PspC (stress-responsive transcriptional regulator) [Dyadobacter sp. BE34]MDR7214108.1 phage shock protein PspC (stress-responsive transcriptional regulator) [Dyadobacter sp. BE31]MDR7260753
MKKTISINIGGIIFHIEEDGYEKLKGYLASIQKYFSSFADSKEILSDIEGRIAERFLNKQKTENKQVISLSDVDELIAAMGTVADFEAIEEGGEFIADPLETASAQTSTPKQESYSTYNAPNPPKTEPAKPGTPRKLYRDLRRKLLGGVAAGLAHYFTIDAIWVRLAFLFAVVGLPAGSGMLDMNAEEIFGPISGFSVLVYIAMWVAFPGSTTLEEDAHIKKFYRDPDRKVVGGVAAGVASYFGVDLGVVRFLWVLSILLFGTGFLIYIVLWVIAPNANTLTEKMEMQGEPITLSNIESNIKQSLNLEERGGEEHVVTKILLLPFRAIGLVFSALGKLLRGLGPVLRVLIGAFLIGMSALGLLGIVIAAGVALGLTSAGVFDNLPIPMLIYQELPEILILSGILVAAIPLVTFLLLGLTLVSNKRIVGGSVWLTLLGLWIVGVVGATVGGLNYQRNFAKRGEVTETTYYAVPRGTLTLDYNHIYDEENIDVDVRLAGFNAGDSIKLEKTLRARGRSREDAEKNAREIKYDPKFRDSVFVFTEGPTLSTRTRFRDQEIDLTVNVPYNKPFAMKRDFYHQLNDWESNQQHLKRYNLHDADDAIWNSLIWVMKRDSGLVCTNIPLKYIRSENSEGDQDGYSFEYNDNSDLELGERGNYSKQFPVADFKKVDIGGAYSIIIRQGTEYSVTADSDNQENIDDIKVVVEDGVLRVKRNRELNLFDHEKWERIGIVITMPSIEDLSLSGANKTLVTEFKDVPKLNVDISGASKTELNVFVDQLSVNVSGASKATLRGSAKSAKLDAHGACKVTATEMNIQNAEVSASGASKVELSHVPNLNKHASGASKINVQ